MRLVISSLNDLLNQGMFGSGQQRIERVGWLHYLNIRNLEREQGCKLLVKGVK